jgi:uncharacterized protein YkwD
MALTTQKQRKPPAAHKRRVGQHHRQSKQYVKHYWPYLPMLLIVGLGLFVNSLWSTSGVLGASSDYSSSALLGATNASRVSGKLSPLTLDAKLTAAAQAKANDLVTKNYWAHTSPSGQSPWEFIGATGYQYQTAGENLAYGFSDANSTETGWMNSPEHKANILNNSYTQVGFATATSPNYQGKGPTTIVVAEYASPVPAVANISFSVDNPPVVTAPAVKSASAELAAVNVSRVQLITGGHATWSLFAVSLIASTFGERSAAARFLSLTIQCSTSPSY